MARPTPLAAAAAWVLPNAPVHEPVHARASAPVILLLCVIPPRTLYPRTRAGPARHELTVFRIAVKYSSRAMSGAGVRRSHSPASAGRRAAWPRGPATDHSGDVRASLES